MSQTSVFLRVSLNMFILIKVRGRSSVGRAPALQVDKRKRCAFVRFRRWRMGAEARIIRSSQRAQDRLRGSIGSCWGAKPSRWALGSEGPYRSQVRGEAVEAGKGGRACRRLANHLRTYV